MEIIALTLIPFHASRTIFFIMNHYHPVTEIRAIRKVLLSNPLCGFAKDGDLHWRARCSRIGKPRCPIEGISWETWTRLSQSLQYSFDKLLYHHVGTGATGAWTSGTSAEHQVTSVIRPVKRLFPNANKFIQPLKAVWPYKHYNTLEQSADYDDILSSYISHSHLFDPKLIRQVPKVIIYLTFRSIVGHFVKMVIWRPSFCLEGVGIKWKQWQT